MKKVVPLILFTIISFSLIAQKSNNEIINLFNYNYINNDYDRAIEVIKFNEDTILIAGYFEDTSAKTSNIHNIVYKTINGGKDWRAIKFNGAAWIYTTTHLQNGQIWMGGSDEYIHYSKDYGDTWERLDKPLKPITRILSIYMKNDTVGIVGGRSNGLAITYDNWNTTTQIPTPLEQGLYKTPKNSSRDRVEKIALLESIILINQNDNIYCTKIDLINWKEFNVPIIDFNFRNDKNEIHLKGINRYYVLNQDLDLLSTSLIENKFLCNLPFEKQDINVSSYFDSKIKSMTIKSIIFTPIKNSLISENKRSANVATLRKKRNGRIVLNNSFYSSNFDFKNDIFKSIFDDDKYKNISNSNNRFNFNEDDMKNFKEILFERFDNYNSRTKHLINPWDIDKYDFENLKPIFENIDLENLLNINNYSCLDIFFNPRNYFEITIKNDNSEYIYINNTNSVLFSLPWEITYNGNKTYCYDPKLTFLLRDIISPLNLGNENLLLGGEIIYEAILRDILNRLHYVNPLR